LFVKGVGGISLADQLVEYQERRNLPGAANFSLEGYIEPLGAARLAPRHHSLRPVSLIQQGPLHPQAIDPPRGHCHHEMP
jgi:hypothetical protein